LKNDNLCGRVSSLSRLAKGEAIEKGGCIPSPLVGAPEGHKRVRACPVLDTGVRGKELYDKGCYEKQRGKRIYKPEAAPSATGFFCFEPGLAI